MALATAKRTQLRLLALLMRDTNFRQLRNLITPDDFMRTEHKKLCKLIISYRDRFPDDRITSSSFREYMRLDLRKKGKLGEYAEHKSTLATLKDITLTDRSFLRKLALDNAKKARFEALLDKGVLESGEWDYDRMYDGFKKIQSLESFISMERGHMYLADFASRKKWYQDVEEAPFKTGYSWLDERLDLGGLFGGELILFLAPPGVGKSQMLCQIGFNQVKKFNKNFTHFPLEMSALKIARRLDSMASRLRKEEFVNMMEALEMAIRKARDGAENADIDIRSFPTKSASIDMLDAYLEYAYTETNFFPSGGLAVDYLNILKSSIGNKADKYAQLEANAEDLRALAQKWDIPIYSAIQGNRESLQKRVLDLDDLAGSFAPAFVADHVLAISQTREELKKRDDKGYQQLRIIMAKNRENESGTVFHCIWNKGIGDLRLDPLKKTENDSSRSYALSFMNKVNKPRPKLRRGLRLK